MSMNKPDIEQNQGRGGDTLHSIGYSFWSRGSFLSSSVWPPSLFRRSQRWQSRFWLAGSFSSAELPAESPPSGWAECRVSDGRSSRRSLELRPVSCSCCGH